MCEKRKPMRIEVLVAAMHQKDTSLVLKMNLQTDAVIGNQGDRDGIETALISDMKIEFINRCEKGVGQNRNTALVNANCDIAILADEDMVFVNNYREIVLAAFEELSDADAIIFNLDEVGRTSHSRVNTKVKRVRFYSAFNYGAPRIAFKLTSVKRENILFHRCFGGGTIYSSGEDTLFIADMLRKGLKIYTYPLSIATVYQGESTWFTGYNEKYLHDKGALFSALAPKFASMLCLQDLIRHRHILKESGLGFWTAYASMRKGIKNFKSLSGFSALTAGGKNENS